MSKELVSIIRQYNDLLTRFARRLLTEPSLTEGIVVELFEEMYDQNKLYPGPDLRNNLKTALIHKCEAYNIAFEVYKKSGAYKLDLEAFNKASLTEIT